MPKRAMSPCWSTASGASSRSQFETTAEGSTLRRMPYAAGIGDCSECVSAPAASGAESPFGVAPAAEPWSPSRCRMEPAHGALGPQPRSSRTAYVAAPSFRAILVVMASPIRVMTVDDHPIYRDGLAALIAVHADLE